MKKRTATKPVVSGLPLEEVAELRLAMGGVSEEDSLLEASKPKTSDKHHKAVLDFIKG